MAIGRISFDKNRIRNVGSVMGTWSWLQRGILGACVLCTLGKGQFSSSSLYGPYQKHFTAIRILGPTHTTGNAENPRREDRGISPERLSDKRPTYERIQPNHQPKIAK